MESVMSKFATKAQVLTEALPYIQKYAGKVVVIKYGGHAMVNEGLKQSVMSDILLLKHVGVKVVMVHGGGSEITNIMDRLNIESRFIGGMRYTDKAAMDVVQMVLAGKINKDLVALIGKLGGEAVGLCGVDGNMIRCKKLEGEHDLGLVGEIIAVNPAPILSAITNGYIPVIATMGVGDDGSAYNINADVAAAEVAAALGAENIITLTDIPGLLLDVSDPATLVPVVTVAEIQGLIDRGIVSGGMIPKVHSLERAVLSGVRKAVMVDGRTPHSILIEMFSDEGIGTMIIK